MPHENRWPALPCDGWRDTYTTLHLWSQVVGKIRLATTPWLDHGWHVALYVDLTGLTTSPMPWKDAAFELRLYFVDQALKCETREGRRSEVPLAPQSVAQFFFWGSFDLAVSRFSGRRAPLHEGIAPGVAPIVMQEAYSHEVSSAGFWPGGGGVDASFYSYVYPEPPGFKDASISPASAGYSETFRQFLLPYEAVRTASDPDAVVLEFLQSTYEAAANAAHWDRAALECALGRVGVCRPAT
jgi:hypothetical protein